MKGQFTVDYYIAIIIFILFIGFISFRMSTVRPVYLQTVDDQRVRIEAYQISEILVNDVGEPNDWENFVGTPDQIKRIGLSDLVKNKQNFISLDKVSAFQNFCDGNDFSAVKAKFDVSFEFSVILVDKTTGDILLSCSSSTTPQPIRADFRRLTAFENGYGELILQMW